MGVKRSGYSVESIRRIPGRAASSQRGGACEPILFSSRSPREDPAQPGCRQRGSTRAHEGWRTMKIRTKIVTMMLAASSVPVAVIGLLGIRESTAVVYEQAGSDSLEQA